MKKLSGRIIYADGNIFNVLASDNKIYPSKPIGKLKQFTNKPIIGDLVTIAIPQNDNREEINTIIELKERKNHFNRPSIANIDQAFIAISLKNPNLDLNLLMKFLVLFQFQHIEPIILFTKYDLLENDEAKKLEQVINFFNSLDFKNIILDFKINSYEQILPFLKENSLNVIAGQSGVGKTTIVNFLDQSLHLKTNVISIRLNRGKHTTRSYKAYLINNSFLVDTPGFSSLELTDLSNEEIADNFLNFYKLKSKCQFNNCIHLNEPNCEVKKVYLNENNLLNLEIYEIYKKLLH